MAYFEQVIMSATAGGTDANDDIISIVNGAIADSFINKAVTYDGQPADLANPKVKLAGTGDAVIGAILGVSYGKLQIAVDGWDIKFLLSGSGTTDITPGLRIIGAQNTDDHGFVSAVPALAGAPVQSSVNNIYNGRGAVLKGDGLTATNRIIRVTMRFGG